MIKYFHEMSQHERFEIYNKRKPWGKTAEEFPQPPWCKRKQAVDGLYGCQDLWLGAIKDTQDCEYCEFYKENK